MHALAHELIEMGVRLPETLDTINQYVNDAIGFHMTSEVVLYVSENCYGTADTISFSQSYLQIHDLKNGRVKTSENQLYVYAAMFCIEYGMKPHEINTELRIYQNNERRVYQADPERILYIMDKIRTFDRRVTELKEQPSL